MKAFKQKIKNVWFRKRKLLNSKTFQEQKIRFKVYKYRKQKNRAPKRNNSSR